MSYDYVMDIMNDLDEDLILETAQQRSRSNKHNRKWIFPAAIAASFAFAVSAFLYAGGLDLFAQNNESGFSASENDVYYSMDETYRHESESVESVQESPSIIITLDHWTDDGFVGTVSEIVDTEVFPIGSKVSVKTDENTSFLTVSDDLADDVALKIQTDTTNSQPITLCVSFRIAESKDCAVNEYDNENMYYIYAEQVWPTETIHEWGSAQ